jgi:3-phenylpropionate/trans-cinnamate dioxygenase ferredoxin component
LRVEAIDLLLVRDGERIIACERVCPHEQADLSLGHLKDGRLFCPRHLASFAPRDSIAGFPKCGGANCGAASTSR